MSLFFLLLLFNPWATPQVPTVDQLKKDSFSSYEKIVLQMSLSLPLTAISYKRLVTGSGKKEINSLAQQTFCLRILNEQMLMRKSLCVYGRKFQSSSLGVCCLNEILCAPSFGGGLHQRFTFFSAVHMWNEIDCKRFLQSPLVVMSFWTQWTTVVSRN